MNKDEIIEVLEKAGIEFDPTSPVKDLKKLLPKNDAEDEDEFEGIQVKSAKEVIPETLPLLIKPPKDKEWDNEAQAEYARYLNAYAYKNPKKFEIKKKSLIKRLIEIGKNPSVLEKYKGNDKANLSFKNHLIAQ